MSAEIIPFDFEEQAVRVVMRDEEPWFVAADICRVLEIQNPTMAVKGLDEDEFTLSTIEGSHRPTNLINESGLYALVLTSRKEAAKRFRKWITSEVLPAIRRTGRYEHPGLPEAAPSGEIAGLPIREAELWLQMVREARLTRGARAAVSIWDRSPLPPLQPVAALPDPSEGRAALAHIRAALGAVLEQARAGSVDLTAQGLRARPDGLFVANFPLALFEGTRWEAGRHRAALAGLPGAAPLPVPLTLGGVVTRGQLLPWALLSGEGA
ncbi:MAG: hypothetical protein CML69_10880 [Rhodobacteraceae bacterium]|nr:hypothetical protein [Paracoccaceae bacterium]